MIQIIKKNIPVEPQYLNKNLKQYILNYANENIDLISNEELGQVIDVIDVISCDDNYISPADSMIIFKTILSVNVIKPLQNEIYDCEINILQDCVVFGKIKGVIRVLIIMDSVVFNNENMTYESEDKKTIISMGDIVKVRIKCVRYKEKKFDCFGNLLL